jgi:hypothetical protein
MIIRKIDGEDGKWYALGAEFQFECCDCGLVHDIEIRKFKGKFQIRLFRNRRSTSASRRERRKHRRNKWTAYTRSQ